MRKLFSLVVGLLVCILIIAGCNASPPATSQSPVSNPQNPLAPVAAPAQAPTSTAAPTAPPSTSPTAAPSSTSAYFVPYIGPAKSGVKTGGTLKVAVPTDAVALGHPQSGAVAWDDLLAAPAIERLCNLDTGGNAVPWLAESWKLDNASMTLTINLRKGIQFSDGTPFNAEAAKWNLDLCIAKKLSAVNSAKSVDIIDEYTVRVNLGSWVPDADANILGISIVSPAAWQKNGEEWGKQNPVGTGPFIFESRQREVNIKYVKNLNYWMQGKPYLDGVTYLIIPDATTRMTSYKAGEVDMTLDPTIAQCQELSNNSKYVIHNLAGGLNSNVLGPSANDPASPFSKLEVRQALGYAIDRESLVKSILGGYGEVSNQQWPPGTWPNNPNIKGYPYNPDKAKELLTAAGYPNGFDTKIIGSSAAANEMLVATALQGMLAKVGIRAALDIQAAAAASATYRGGWDGILIMGLGPNPGMATFTMSGTLSSAKRVFFVSILKSPTIDAAITEALTSPDMKTYATKVQKVMELVYDQEVQLVPIFVGDSLLVKYPYVKDDYFYVTSGHKLPSIEDAWLDR